MLSSPAPIHGLHRLHGKSSGHQVIGIMSAPAHHDQALDLPHDKDQAALHEAGDTQRGSLCSQCAHRLKDRERRTVYRRAQVTTDVNYRCTVKLTGPTNPKSPERTNGISPIGTPFALTGIT